MKNKKLSTIYDLVRKVNANKTGIFKRKPKLIVILPNNIAAIIGDNKVHISEFVMAKIKGRIKGYKGHPKITDEVLFNLPRSLSNPRKIIQDTRKGNRKEYLFINIEPLHQIVVEIERRLSGHTEINTIFDTTINELKRLEDKLPTVFSSGETPISRMHASP
jgi:hypothetical protein